jgi:hypothetical protein
MAAVMDKMERIVESSPRMEREDTADIFLQKFVEMQEMDEKAPVDAGVEHEAQGGVLHRVVWCIHDGRR